MPRGDGTGPDGFGPMTGRGAGFCAGYAVPGFRNPGFGRGLGRGLRRGFVRAAPINRIVPVQQPTKEQERQYLENEVNMIEQERKALDQEIESIRKRLEELK